MTNFLHKSKKRAGTVNVTELATYLGKDETTIRALKRTNPQKFEIIYLGAVCIANNIKIEDLKRI